MHVHSGQQVRDVLVFLVRWSVLLVLCQFLHLAYSHLAQDVLRVLGFDHLERSARLDSVYLVGLSQHLCTDHLLLSRTRYFLVNDVAHEFTLEHEILHLLLELALAVLVLLSVLEAELVQFDLALVVLL